MKPITENYLIELNLPKRTVIGGTMPYFKYSIRNHFDIYCYMDCSGNCLFWGECPDCADFFIIKCDTIQEFKSIYTALAGEKLVVKAKRWTLADIFH